jgi:hypothetical protein
MANSGRLKWASLHNGSRVFARDDKNSCGADLPTSSGPICLEDVEQVQADWANGGFVPTAEPW